jgi:pimeloyl-ACP methyl ester carboxylesterase
MIKKALICISGLLVLLSISCASGQQKGTKEFSPSKIYPAVACVADTNLSYALFLPPGYKKEKPCPVLILFDPHGDGLLPVNLFNTEAAKNGFIIAGSNNSKNGMSIEQTTAIYRNIITDLISRFNIEKRAIYLCGFSGGSRVAGAAAITEGGVAGVVGCGAGLPNTNRKPVSPFSYLAVAGNQDFNYTELYQLDKSLEQAGFQHYFLVFDGIHEWPHKEIIPEIFTWLRFDAMKQQAIPVDRTEINTFIEKNDKIAGDFSTQGKLYQKKQIYIKMLHYLTGLTDVAPLQAEINRLSSEKKVIANEIQQKQLFEMEQELQQKYSPAIEQESIEWWTAEAARLTSLSVKSGNPDQNQVYKRVLGFLSLNCYMYSTGALKNGNLVAASKYIKIYELVDPTNAEHCYLAAKVAALKNQPDNVYIELNKAFSLGFKDLARLKADADFNRFHSDQRFKKLISGS